MSTATPTTSGATPSFSSHIRAVARAVQSSFAELVQAVGADASSPQSISRQLGVNKNLAWKISKIIVTVDSTAALQQMPGAAGLRIFFEKLEAKSVRAELLHAAQIAVEEYDRLIEVHSGDRTTLEMMGAELSSAGRQQRDEYHRKLLFQGASYVVGAQARVNLKIGITGPGSEDGLLDFVSVNGLIDFRRLRDDVTWVMGARHSQNDDGSAMSTSASGALDERYQDPEKAPLMEDFCSQPLPQLRRFVDGPMLRYELVEGPVGNTGALTCVVGAVQRGIPYYRAPDNEWGVHLASCDIPAELLVLDVFFHKSFTFAMSPDVLLYSHQAVYIPEPKRERFRLPLNDKLQDLGLGGLPPATPEVPRYTQLVKDVFARSGWNADDFHGFRMKIAYPAYPTALVLRYPLPEKT